MPWCGTSPSRDEPGVVESLRCGGSPQNRCGLPAGHQRCTERSGDMLVDENGCAFSGRPRHYSGGVPAAMAVWLAWAPTCGCQPPTYDRYVRQMRGFLRTEINRVLNRLVEVQRPGRIMVEKLYFRNPTLSRRMNRLVTNAGRRIIEDKLTDLREQYGIEIEYVNPAYGSQTCSACDYVDRKNRAGERFTCGWCGRTLHADVNASRNLRARRSRPAVGSVKQSKAAVLRAQVLAFQRLSMERWGNPKGRRGTSRDPREGNAYFQRYTPEVTSNRTVATSASAACATRR